MSMSIDPVADPELALIVAVPDSFAAVKVAVANPLFVVELEETLP